MYDVPAPLPSDIILYWWSLKKAHSALLKLTTTSNIVDRSDAPSTNFSHESCI